MDSVIIGLARAEKEIEFFQNGGQNISPVRPGYVHCQILIFSAVLEFYSVKKKEKGHRGDQSYILMITYPNIYLSLDHNNGI